MKCTNNGLMDFKNQSNEILKDAINLIEICRSVNGHLGDVISCLRTTTSSLNIKVEQLADIFDKQKA